MLRTTNKKRLNSRILGIKKLNRKMLEAWTSLMVILQGQRGNVYAQKSYISSCCTNDWVWGNIINSAMSPYIYGFSVIFEPLRLIFGKTYKREELLWFRKLIFSLLQMVPSQSL